MYLLCEKTTSNDAKKLAKMRCHLERLHSYKKNKDVEYFKTLRQKLSTQPILNACLSHLLVLIVKKNMKMCDF